ncbi:MAG: cellulose biosynthesis protein BcsS [Beijerinckiaceae bacterium]
MRLRWRTACAGLAHIWAALLANPAAAQGWLPPWLLSSMPTAPMSGARSETVIFSSFEADDFSLFSGTGLKWRPAGFAAQNGFAVLASVGHSFWRNRHAVLPGFEERVLTTRGSVLAGRDVKIGTGTLGVYAGIEMMRETAFDPFALWLRQFNRVGARVQLDWWQHPTDTTLLTANVAAGTIKREIWGRVAHGWKIGSYGYIGPEVSAAVSVRDAVWRGGVHWSEIPLWAFRLRISGGLAYQRGRAGAYVAFSNYYKF